jgi:DNA-directed RNA polymerase specialized sigma24 family protein
MKAETDGTLLYYMSCHQSADDKAVANAAGAEFHRRHMAALYERCKRICGRLGEPISFAEDLALVALAKAVRAHGTFVDVPESGTQAKRTQAWLGRIARNLVLDKLRNPYRPGPLTGIQEEVPFDDYSAEDFASLHCDGKRLPKDTETIRLAADAIATLDQRTRLVIVHTTLQRQRSPGGSYAYRGSATALAKKLGTTSVNVRRIYGIGIRAIASYVSTHRKRL